MIIELVVNKVVLCIVNKYQCNMFSMCSFFFCFTVTGINNTIHSKYSIGNRKHNSKLPVVIFQINSIRETSIVFGFGMSEIYTNLILIVH